MKEEHFRVALVVLFATLIAVLYLKLPASMDPLPVALVSDRGQGSIAKLSQETCEKIEKVQAQAAHIQGLIVSGQTTIDPESDLADQIIGELDGIIGDLSEISTEGGCGDLPFLP